ncbi:MULTISPECIES: class I SAM-dependent methyltransferase [Candidatus Ichthyocystis]|uniref:Ubiquinone/menaquinone biosynthesis C-methyltransferase UbiE n=1 Tax=Candidatus Ichthyocystis hellenicum TaxID=1561003 RepID=A0A0S4M2M9_9BURK|nr:MULTISPECIES: class I SAM-dependent methyltransferase [Ichthyocystis]CUT17002.1 Ubiquinone/menaquinone biosynthesis methyltransferase [Candidatus Ichthyocystis hellenicum]
MRKNHYFGFKKVTEKEKTERVKQVFQNVSPKYNLMNDIMSLGLHRLWKKIAVCAGNIYNPETKILDVASGSGDLALLWAEKSNQVIVTDINQHMLEIAKSRLINQGVILPSVLCSGEKLPFQDKCFEVVSCSFGVRNMTNKDLFLSESYRVLQRGGKLIILEFSKPYNWIKRWYNLYSWHVIPWLGEVVAHDRDSYQYLVESIRMHPCQETFKNMIHSSGFNEVCYHNIMGGIVALHVGIK